MRYQIPTGNMSTLPQRILKTDLQLSNPLASILCLKQQKNEASAQSGAEHR